MKKRKYTTNKIDVSKIKRSKYFIPNLYDHFNNCEINSWFDLKRSDTKVDDGRSFNLTSRKPVIDSKLIRAKQVKLKLTLSQQNIIKKWIEVARIVYNITVYFFRKNKILSFYDTRKIVKPLFSSDLKNIIDKYTVPNHVVDNAINDVVKAYKTSYSLQKKKIIKCFKIRYKKFSKDNQTIVIEKEDFSKVKNGFYISYLGEINCNHNLMRNNILCNTRLTYKKLTNTFILNIPTYVDKYETKPTNRICSIDPGYKTFLTVYNPNGHCLKVFNRKDTTMLTQLLRKRISARRIIDEQYSNYDVVMRNSSQYKKIKRYYKRISTRIQNLVKELHYKSAHMLCQVFDKILLGKLSTKGITSKANKMPAFEKHYAYMISHYKFSTILAEVAEKYNTEVKIVCESYTSKTCGGCGHIQNISNLDIYDCKQCNIRIDRDLNGARNILIKNVN